MTKVQPRTPSGFTEYLPDEQIEFNRLMAIIRHTYEKYGFVPLDTPVLELSEVLLAKGGGETEQQVYRFERGRNDLTMRYDLTVPLARYVAEHESDLVFPFRRYQIGKVYRAERAQAGRFREFYQCDIDVIGGSQSPITDAEFPAIINEIFTDFNFGEFTIRLNDRRVLNGFFEEVSDDVLRVIDKMEKISRDELVAELGKTGLDDGQIDRVLQFTTITGTNDETIARLKELAVSSERFKMGIDKLEALIAALRVMKVPESRFKIDLRIVRGLAYYTGTVYETILNDYPEVGSVCSGGRYDDLASHYTSTQLPGVGISIGLSRLFYKLREAGVIKPSSQSPARIVVMPLGDDQIETSVAVAAMLREAGVATMLYIEPNNMKKKMRYADRMGFTYVVLIGEQEQASGAATVKNMKTGTSEVITTDNLARYVSA